jgi:hypothetical protein
VASLVERHLGPLYPNFPRVRPILVRQARDLLVCTFHGNLVQFEHEFCIPASELLHAVRDIANRKVCAHTNHYTEQKIEGCHTTVTLVCLLVSLTVYSGANVVFYCNVSASACIDSSRILRREEAARNVAYKLTFN